MQFEQIAPGVRNPLPKPSIDTGAGLERVAAVLQGKHDNYDIDLFVALIRAISELTGADPQGEQKASLRVIADHLRASSFLIADGVLPSNEGRGYVLRRIMRRAMRHAQLLGAQGSADASAGLGAGARDGPGLSGTGARRKPDRGNAAAGRDPLPQDAGTRPDHSRREKQLAQKGRHVRRRHRVHAVRHLWLSARSDPGRAAQSAASASISPPSPMRWTASAPRRARPGRAPAIPRAENVWFPLREKARRHRIPGLRDRDRRRRGRRAGQGRQGSRQPQGRRDRRDRAEPDAVLCASPAARSATPA